MINSDNESRFSEYLHLIDLSYADAVEFLLHKHGPVMDDYFKETSYNRFLKGETFSIAKGNFSRWNEGLFTHHISENRAESLGYLPYIRQYEYPFFTTNEKTY